jgi:N4-gp56 family major capsid protein
MQNFSTQSGRLNRFSGEILKHAVPQETLAKGGRQVKFPRNSSDTYVSRRWLPYGASAASPNTFFANGTGDRSAALVNAHRTQEGVTSTPDSITAQDVTVVMQQYDCLYGFTDKMYFLHEDNISDQMAMQVGERMALVNEMICFGELKSCTNKFFGGTGTSRATVNGKMTLPMLRKIAKSLQNNHAKPVTTQLAASDKYDTSAVSAGYFVYCHTDFEPDIRDLVGFTPVEKYATGEAQPNEIGKCERFRFIASPEFVSVQDSGVAVGATGLFSTSAVNIDVYQFIVTGADAWSQVAVRGLESMSSTLLLPGEKSKSDPHGQRGYSGAIWWKAAVIENNGWMVVGEAGVTAL